MGQIIVLQPGIQAPPDLRNTIDTIVTVSAGQAVFNAPIKIGGSKNLMFDGGPTAAAYAFKAGHTGNVFETGKGGIIGLKVIGFDFGTAKLAFDANTKIYLSGYSGPLLKWTGDPATAVFYDVTVDRFLCGPNTQVLSGTWEANPTLNMVCIGMKFFNGTITNDATTLTNLRFKGNSVYGLQAKKITVKGPTAIGGEDYGIFFIQGSAHLEEIYRDNGFGYLERIILAVLSGIPAISQFCGIVKCIDVRSTNYGTVDVRIDPGILLKTGPIIIEGSDFFFMNNTSGDKTDSGQYVTNAMVYGKMNDGTKQWNIYAENNFAFNAMPGGMAAGSSLLKDNSSGTTTVQAFNNVDLAPGTPLPAGYVVDKVDFVPVTGGPLDKTPYIGAVKPPVKVGRTAVKIETTAGKSIVTYDDGSSTQL